MGYFKQIGRDGRKGQQVFALSIVSSAVDIFAGREDVGKDAVAYQAFLRGNECSRLAMSGYMDGQPVDCRSLAAVFCNRCRLDRPIGIMDQYINSARQLLPLSLLRPNVLGPGDETVVLAGSLSVDVEPSVEVEASPEPYANMPRPMDPSGPLVRDALFTDRQSPFPSRPVLLLPNARGGDI